MVYSRPPDSVFWEVRKLIHPYKNETELRLSHANLKLRHVLQFLQSHHQDYYLRRP